jgi:hypothetical protein
MTTYIFRSILYTFLAKGSSTWEDQCDEVSKEEAVAWPGPLLQGQVLVLRVLGGHSGRLVNQHGRPWVLRTGAGDSTRAPRLYLCAS